MRKPETYKTITRYAITMVDKAGLRVLADANQGRLFRDTREAMEEHLAAILNVNGADKLRQVYGDVSKLRVDPVQCWENGDACGTVFGYDATTIAQDGRSFYSVEPYGDYRPAPREHGTLVWSAPEGTVAGDCDLAGAQEARRLFVAWAAATGLAIRWDDWG